MKKVHIYFSLLTLLSITPLASAEPLLWRTAGWVGTEDEQPYQSCKKFYDLVVISGNGTNLISYTDLRITRKSEVEFWCGATEKWSNLPNPIIRENVYVTFQIGTICESGKIYDPEIGTCRLSGTPPEQKGYTNNNSCGEPGSFEGNPINIATGNKFQLELDHVAPSISLERAYNSADNVWRYNFSAHLRIGTNKIAVVFKDGRETYFTLQGTTAIASEGEFGSLENKSDHWVYRSANNEIMEFNMKGRLTKLTQPSGTDYKLSYDKQTIAIQNNLGETMSLTEDAFYQPLTAHVGNTSIGYIYDDHQRLTKVTKKQDDLSEQRFYHYEDPRNSNLLTGITDERGIRYATWTYD
ncbi:DUF6531 domain-containing protein, partial [Pseudomonas indica]|uniref:DUF6531 domain-containing protein n=1 Tax=Pseudomonas indica TaxID=137658 RepID=UPI003FD3F9C2